MGARWIYLRENSWSSVSLILSDNVRHETDHIPPSSICFPYCALVTEHCISTTKSNPVTMSLAKPPQTQPLDHRTILQVSCMYHQACPTESQTLHRNSSVLNRCTTTVPWAVSILPLQQIYHTLNTSWTINKTDKAGQWKTSLGKLRWWRTRKRDIKCRLNLVRTSAILDWKSFLDLHFVLAKRPLYFSTVSS